MKSPQKTKKRIKITNTHRKTVSPPPQEILESKVEPKMVVPNSVLEEEKEKEWMKSLWDEIREANTNRGGKGETSLVEIDLEKEQMNLDIASRY